MSQNYDKADRAIEVLYRYEDILVSGIDEFDDPLPPRISVRVIEYPVRKWTSKGAWIRVGIDDKFVLLTARKRFACPTLKEAAESFKRRKQVQINKLKAQLKHAESAYKRAEMIYEKIKLE